MQLFPTAKGHQLVVLYHQVRRPGSEDLSLPDTAIRQPQGLNENYDMFEIHRVRLRRKGQGDGLRDPFRRTDLRTNMFPDLFCALD